MQKNGTVLVCVTPQKSSRYLVDCGMRLAEQLGCTLRILSVLPQKQSFAPDLSVLEALNEAARDAGGEMTVCFSDSPADKVCEIVRESDVCALVAGFPGKHTTHFVTSMHEKMPQLQLWMVDGNGTAYTISHDGAADRKQADGTYRVVLQTAPDD